MNARPSSEIIADHCPLWALTDPEGNEGFPVFSAAEVRKAAWELINDLADALDATPDYEAAADMLAELRRVKVIMIDARHSARRIVDAAYGRDRFERGDSMRKDNRNKEEDKEPTDG